MTICELTLVGLGGGGKQEGVASGDEGDLLRAEGGDGLSEVVDAVSVTVFLVYTVELLQLLLLLLDISIGGGNLFVQRGELFH
jgi:hypothetical protein